MNAFTNRIPQAAAHRSCAGDAVRRASHFWSGVFGLLLLTACAYTAKPPDSAGFASLTELQALAGTYRNLAETAADAAPLYLSALIWPGSPDLPHARIQTIEIEVMDPGWIEVRARDEEMLLHEGRYREGRDFYWRDGRVLLKRDVGMAGLAVGEPVLGPYYSSIELGLDTRGQGKSLQQFGLLGLGYLVVPLVVRGQTEARFIRLEADR